MNWGGGACADAGLLRTGDTAAEARDLPAAAAPAVLQRSRAKRSKSQQGGRSGHEVKSGEVKSR